MASEYLKWKYRDVKPDEKIQYTRRQKMQNWWHYHKWWVLLGVLLLIAGIDIVGNMLGIGQVKPDYQIAYVAPVPLADGTKEALESAFAALGEDCNGDGKVIVQLNAYVDMSVSQDSDAAQYAAAAQVKLMADMESCESYFYLCSDPGTLQANYQILAGADGELPSPGQEPLTFPWEKIAQKTDALASLTGLEGLSFARRGFWQDRSCAFRMQCDALWDRLTEELIP